MKYQPSKHTKPMGNPPNRFHNSGPRQEEFTPPTKATQKCVFCENSGHYSSQCHADISMQQKRKTLVDKRLCWKCFTNSHSSNLCEKSDCPMCGRKHHSTVCYEKTNNRANNTNPPRGSNREAPRMPNTGRRYPHNASSYNQPPNNLHTSDPRRRPYQTPSQGVQHSNPGIEKTTPSAIHQEQVILMTAEGNIWNHNTCEFQKILFFFDTGAQKSVINEALADKLGLPKLKTETCVMSGIGGHTEMFQSNIVSLKIGSAYGKDLDILVQTKPIVTNGFPSIKLTSNDKQFLQSKEICVSNSKLRGEHQNPDILVGLDYYHNFVLEMTENGTITPSGLKVARTIFGPTLYGKGILDIDPKSAPIMYGMTAIVPNTESEMLHKMFELEGLGISSGEERKNDEILEYFEEYSKQISFLNGHITAPFPLKSNHLELSDNYAVAIKRVISLHTHLNANPKQKHLYCKTISDYISNGIVESIDGNVENSVGTYYMPHSGVWREHKPKPLRIVFDASSKKKNELSLNDVIFKGESFVNKIHDILISSRLSKIILLCDIEAAFTQIRLLDSHKDLCRFLWFKDFSKPPTRENVVELRFKRLPFGITASPSILNMALISFLSRKNTMLTKEIMKNLYVDNILLHAQTEEEATQKYQESKSLFAEIGMNLREFVSNSDAVNITIPEADKAPVGETKLLGVNYNTKTDQFSVKISFPNKQILTKRDIVSQINSVYDPIGIAAPLMVKLKSLMREIFETTSDWEKRIPLNLAATWISSCNPINNISLSIPRYIGSTDTNQETRESTLWIFADASMMAIATCAFFKNNITNEVSSLVSGKTRLAPKKSKQTIPKLELIGIVIGMRLAKTIFDVSKHKISQINIASDSEIALSWIKKSGKVPIFVDNQRNHILKLKRQFQSQGMPVSFFHVPTALNPADAGTRGVSYQEVTKIGWIKGPCWLSNPEALSQLKEIANIDGDYDEEVVGEDEQKIAHPAISQLTQGPTPLIDLSRFSRLSLALRVIARCGKLICQWTSTVNNSGRANISLQNIVDFSNNHNITAEDMALAESIILQHEHKHLQISELQKRFPHKRIIRDEKGIIRHESRMQNAIMENDTKSPMYLSGTSELARLILQKIHNENAHCGKEQTLCILRQRFWLPKPSATFSKYLRKCTVCKRYQGLPFGAPDMPPLPRDRVVTSKPFQNTGCDFFGPIHAINQDMMYVCLFTCLTTRAVHLEVVENMSTGAFLECLIRFVSRRGVPKLMRTDCGSNFKLGERIVNSMFHSTDRSEASVMTYSANAGIRWLFNPPGAPWMGGAWERMVGTVKKAFHKAIGRRRLTFTQLNTAMAQIEAIINTRPLAKSASSDLAKIPLRPVDFLQGNLEYGLPITEIGSSGDSSYEPELIQTARQALQALEHSERIANRFWEEWNSEYLTKLRDMQRVDLAQPRHISLRKPVLGEIVLIEREFMPRGSWSYGKITELIKSNDGEIRSVKMTLPNRTVLHRPLNKIYPLELRCNPHDENHGEEDQRPTSIVTNRHVYGTEVRTEPQEPDENPESQSARQSAPQVTRPVRKSRQLALEVIRNFEESLEEPQSSSSYSQSVRPSYYTLTILLIFTILQSTTAKEGNLACNNGIVSVYPPYSKFTLCMHEACKTFLNNTAEMLFKLPPSSIRKEINISMSYPYNTKTNTIIKKCLVPHICEHSQRLLSKKLFANPHCWPVGAIASIAALLYLTILVKLLLCYCLRRNRKINMNIEIRPIKREQSRLRTFSPAPIVPNTVTLSICILALTTISSACQHGHMRNNIDLVCTESNKCSHDFSREILFNRIQTDLCVNIRHANKTVGTIEIRNKPMRMVCSKRMLFYTRDTLPQIYSAVRCPEAGSCTKGTCAKLRSNDTVKELIGSSQYPGYSGCERSCGGLSCGCLLPLPACSFYRVAHVPRSEQVYEIVECAEWKPSVHIEVKMNIYNKVLQKDIIFQPYVPQNFDSFTITAISVQKPQLAILSRRFALSQTDSLLIPDRFSLPVECPHLSGATSQFKDCLNRMICACRGTNPPTKCECPKENIYDIKNDVSNHLPILSPFFNLNRDHDDLFLTTDEGEITILVNSKIMLDSADFILEQECEILLSNLTGCYNCQEGAHLEVSCHTNKPAWITLMCGENTFPIECGPSKNTSTVVLDFSHAVISETCHTTCRNQLTNQKLEGILAFLPKDESLFKIHDPQSWEWVDKIDWFKEFSLPDITPIIHVIKNHWKSALTALSAIALLTILTYAFGPIILISLLRFGLFVTQSLMQIIVAIIRGFAEVCRR